MTLSRRGLLAATLALPFVGTARAQPGWQPSRPIQLIVGFAPGGGSDIIARTIAEAAAPLFPQPLVVVNRPGAGGAIAAEFVSRAAPDGHTLLIAGGSESTSLPAHRDLPYDPKRSFTAVIRLTRNAHFICARGKGGRFTSMQQVIEAAKARPEAVTHGSSGVGTLSHSIFIMLGRATGTELLHVPYTGGGPQQQALLAGQVDLVVQASDELRGLAASGDIVPLACASAQRMPAYPQVPTLRELGIDLVADNMKGWVGPAGMPPAMVGYLHDRFRRGMATPGWQRFMEQTGEADGYADGSGFQRDMDTLLDNIRAAMRRA
ncbi:Bug family tripartite tricarboxylate transporter substrate binding protein [Falsiroseomonas selenitidurans]|uniref:Tripartite tricarboxylate transporter substrate binding protein n=1 Tax=Falsiroseomonas selenitidurans TaxID=2716335 RepID=A0ABX1E837_9PROT|nr:tripartite tricarboxylate transporter substrate binding protein [Falsiroseomonas selenitidurans]NKC33123.1 tripartite tricarboxylate transporter substrate binding protein [Falsiroseomonas selenitidurans]